MNRKEKGICRLCGKYSKLSFEHIPPHSAFNNKLVYIQNFEHLFDCQSYLYGKSRRSNKGFGDYTLCELCNNNTGRWYAGDFADFVQQGLVAIQNVRDSQKNIIHIYNVKPLNVLKQILTMFMSADSSGHLLAQKDLVNFILNRDIQDLPGKFKVYIYSNLTSGYKLFGYHLVNDPISGIQEWSHFKFRPFGLLLTQDSGPAHNEMVDISEFHQFKYDEVSKVVLITPILSR